MSFSHFKKLFVLFLHNACNMSFFEEFISIKTWIYFLYIYFVILFFTFCAWCIKDLIVIINGFVIKPVQSGWVDVNKQTLDSDKNSKEKVL